MKKVILITGASSGIGYTTAETLAKQRHKVYGAARRIEKTVHESNVCIKSKCHSQDHFKCSEQQSIQNTLSGRGSAKIFVFLHTILPAKVFDAIMVKIMILENIKIEAGKLTVKEESYL